ncbi:MAG TPA: DPP IV N-terminal domain-containing protein [Longimicrobiales bacterium]|nr:DPP IV N-terminal domain-containing protein [Longimicrobiales bacterium]
MRAFTTTILAMCCLTATAAGQGVKADYERAEQFLGSNSRLLVAGQSVQPVWVPGSDRFWYRNNTGAGSEFIAVDPASRTKRPAFDHARLAAALSLANDTSYEPHKLPFQSFEFVQDVRSIRVELDTMRSITCDLSTYSCTRPNRPDKKPVSEVRSPDGKWIAFTRAGNVWVKPSDGGPEIQLTSDAQPDHGYGTPIGCCDQVTSVRQKREKRPVLLWSSDSRKIATYRADERNVKPLYLLETAQGRPILHTYRYALPGDSIVPKLETYVIDVPSRQVVKSDRGPQEAVNTSCCWLVTDTIWKDARWGSGSTDEFFYTHGQRDYKKIELIALDTRTGKARKILEEKSPTFVELNLNSGGIPNWRVINGNREVVWFSERDGWGHLYLFDAATGQLKNRITQGPWVVSDLLHVDEAARTVYFTARGREGNRDPYFRFLYRIGLDGRNLTLLTAEDADHTIAVAASGRYAVDTYSRPDTLPVTVLRAPDGRVLMTLEKADVSRLTARGLRLPERFVVKGRDGMTDVYGLLYRPSRFNPAAKYPVVDYIYPGPQIGPIGNRTFTVSPRGDAQALAELGFMVFQVDAFGTPLRSKAFHDAYYGNMGDNGLPDHIAALRQLAGRHPQLDLERVGIFGHSGGGFSSTDAILRYPDFFKVAVSSAGNHDNRSYDYSWGEKYQGLVKKTPAGGDNFDSQANHLLARNLRGKLFLMYGTLDDNVHPNATLLLIQELIRYNKNFDLLVMPNRNHGFAGEPYVVRRTWDFFVRHLQGRAPPEDFELRRF